MAKTQDSRNARSDFRIPHTIGREDYFRHGTDAWFREAVYTSIRALRGLLRCRDSFADALGITPSQFAVLMGVAYRQEGNGVSVGEVSRHVALGPTHVTAEVRGLIEIGYLTKRPNPNDGRSVLVSLSAKGEHAVVAVTPLIREINDILFHDVDAGSMKLTSEVMQKIAGNSELAIAEILWRKRSGQRLLGSETSKGARRAPSSASRERARS